jgi:hypothetical protein
LGPHIPTRFKARTRSQGLDLGLDLDEVLKNCRALRKIQKIRFQEFVHSPIQEPFLDDSNDGPTIEEIDSDFEDSKTSTPVSPQSTVPDGGKSELPQSDLNHDLDDLKDNSSPSPFIEEEEDCSFDKTVFGNCYIDSPENFLNSDSEDDVKQQQQQQQQQQHSRSRRSGPAPVWSSSSVPTVTKLKSLLLRLQNGQEIQFRGKYLDIFKGSYDHYDLKLREIIADYKKIQLTIESKFRKLKQLELSSLEIVPFLGFLHLMYLSHNPSVVPALTFH